MGRGYYTLLPVFKNYGERKGGDAAMIVLSYHIRGEPPGTAPPWKREK